MGFLDNLKEIGEGLVDVVTAPVGLIVDTAKAWTSSEYNPGFEGTFGKATGQLVEGLGKVGGGLQFDEAGRIIGESQFGDAARELLKQAELIYSTEYQFQTGEAPLQLGNYGFQPGDISLQRGGSAALGFASNAIRGDIEGAQTAWRKSAHSTPGQALIEIGRAHV